MKVLAEFYGVLVGTAKWPVEEAAAEVRRLRLTFPTAETLATTFASALALAGRHAFQIFDAIILTAAAEAHCALLLFEDMQHGFEWQGVTIVNPSEPEPHPLIVAAIGIPTRIIAKEPRPCPS
jgi:predicted nucleic acid-binding protein